MTKSNSNNKLIVFDFDNTLTNYYSDNFAISNLDAEFKEFFEVWHVEQPWYIVMNDLFNKAHSKGFSKIDLLNNLENFPLDPCILKLIETAKEQGFDLVIISDGNELFINQILLNYGIRDHFNLLITNKVNESLDGKLNLVPYLNFEDGEGHDCQHTVNGKKLCNLNLCKGTELNKLLNQNNYDRIVYTGDGENDFCPMLQLRSNDLMCIRKGERLESLYDLEKSNFKIYPEVLTWENHSDLLNIFEEKVFS
ncbi:hypothetical protein CONCODRAFT_80707 [Conidiobolus coronatus NRRL 28638]|uniref:HAD-like protein n=1 Tax=Conidiobolus coronatus (strain ATCC 28846 / CBS 209.66 / NRRL 28638) TaxID=796925 RepID=A0A137NSE5_CONC2|nr:hypothetical protein CONCODRAFT_80707 [Conidiobolus coronatus NRRL 28638]|eukprot:KXN65689.1 hypothetical protein CONCODRAFT_80707 [Conidiobolus coronatus NRRL 28638]